ncbi:uncharacterized protein SCHCODRAFT_02710127 [Schizophyllum commune H4-8]|uniref:Uncharacterized protein n=1 Tax=Schizophyllum commune (strain H4-8 / FGSC 9210) TaxID=578458 RepID=D8PVS3_SCHCM|nr:uncharacterized protein SCHCODRAFT_02710127 [Schizophyllum commune H4-8]KAI5900236.1 hypothetical protein SCHCODRAFT_02710127 [Schizophyllum commune H4-8]
MNPALADIPFNVVGGPHFYASPTYATKRWPLHTSFWAKPMPVSRRQPHAWTAPQYRRPMPEPWGPLFDWSAPWAALPELDLPPSPTDTSSSATSDLSAPSPRPSPPQLVICNAPLVAPRPLPYHSPTFLQFDLLPDVDEDLSHPPYTKRASKRKREDADAESPDHCQPPQQRQKLRVVVPDYPPPLPSNRRRQHLEPGTRHWATVLLSVPQTPASVQYYACKGPLYIILAQLRGRLASLGARATYRKLIVLLMHFILPHSSIQRAAQHCIIFLPFCSGAAKGLCRLIQWHIGCFSSCTTALSMILRRTEARASDGQNELSRSSGTKHACGDEAIPCERGNYCHPFHSSLGLSPDGAVKYQSGSGSAAVVAVYWPLASGVSPALLW